MKHKINLIFHCMVKLKRKINLIKGLKKKRRIKLEKNHISQIEIEWWNWKQIKVLQKDQEEKLKIKRIKIKVEISINPNDNFKILYGQYKF